MRNWSTNLALLKKDKKQYAIWRLEQLVNFGLGKEKLSRRQLVANWQNLRFDPKKKKYLEFLLWNKKAS